MSCFQILISGRSVTSEAEAGEVTELRPGDGSVGRTLQGPRLRRGTCSAEGIGGSRGAWAERSMQGQHLGTGE